MNRKILLGLGAATLVVLLTAGSCSGSPSSVSSDKNETNQQLKKYQTNQPVPQFDRSQLRQTLIDIENAQVHAVATTTFFFLNQGAAPIKSCPSVGFPVPSTDQLTNPQQTVNHGSAGITTLGQSEPNGVYTGDSTGTYVICSTPANAAYVTYWEGYVETEGGQAHWDTKTHQIVLDGQPTVKAAKVK